MKKKIVVKREMKTKKTHERSVVRVKLNIPVTPKVKIEEVVEEVIPEPVKKAPKKPKQNVEKKTVEPVVEQPVEKMVSEEPAQIENNEQNI